MIFVTLGTHEQPFERALDMVLPLAQRERVLVQHGHSPSRPAIANTDWVEFMGYEQMESTISRASGVVCHAGVGTIMTALGRGKRPVVVPRLHELGEHVDDHQLQITRGFADEGLIVPCYPDDDIRARLAEAHGAAAEPRDSSTRLREAVSLAARAA